MPVPETDTGGVVENTEGREVSGSKELGERGPERGEKACQRELGAVKRRMRLVSKNTDIG